MSRGEGFLKEEWIWLRHFGQIARGSRLDARCNGEVGISSPTRLPPTRHLKVGRNSHRSPRGTIPVLDQIRFHVKLIRTEFNYVMFMVIHVWGLQQKKGIHHWGLNSYGFYNLNVIDKNFVTLLCFRWLESFEGCS